MAVASNPTSSRLIPFVPRSADFEIPTRWKKAPQISTADRELAAECNVSPALITILRGREYSTPKEIECFLHPDESCLHDPFTLPDIEPALTRLHRAITQKEKILVFGDYDVDGITSAALLVRALKALKADVECVIPERHEGYGLSTLAVEDAAARGVKLIFSADCGISAVEPARRARELGVDLIISDHHEPAKTESGKDIIPDAIAVINPKREDSNYGFRELSGCGVAFKILMALLQRHWPQHAASFHDKFVELVGLAAVADCVPLQDENRFLAREGLRALATTNKSGLKSLIQSSGLKIKNGMLTGRNVGFMLAPRLNAAGRVDSARKGLELLLSTDGAECEALAEELEGLNKLRQEMTSRVMHEAFARVYENSDLQKEAIIVVAGGGWPHGIIGLVASRLVEKFARPAIVLGIEENGIAKGSGRSVEKFDLTQIIESTRDLTTSGGGHAMACGLALPSENIEAFRQRAIEAANAQLKVADLARVVKADCEVEGDDITPQLVRDLELFEPCGIGNPSASLLLKNVVLVSGKAIGKESQHLKWSLRAGGRSYEAVWWSPGEAANGFVPGCKVDICFVPEFNEWNGNVTVQFLLKAARRST